MLRYSNGKFLVTLFVYIVLMTSNIVSFNIATIKIQTKVNILNVLLMQNRIHVACLQEVNEEGLNLTNYAIYTSHIFKTKTSVDNAGMMSLYHMVRMISGIYQAMGIIYHRQQ